MKVKFACSGCGQKVTVSAAVMGKRGKCPGCGKTIVIPTAERFQAALGAKRGASSSSPGEIGGLDDDPAWSGPDPDDLLSDDLLDDDPLGEAARESALAPASRDSPTQRATATESKRRKPRRTRTWRAFGGMVLGVALMLATVPAAFAAFFVAGQMSASKGWPSVEGSVVSSNVRLVGFGKKKKYQADVRYDYRVDGRPYLGSRIRLGDTTGSSESAQQALANKYPTGTGVKVFYDPQSPGQSVLEPGGLPLLMAIPPLVLGVFGWLFFAVSTGRIKT